MSLASRFTHDLQKRLEDRVGSYTWKVEYRLDRRNKECVDVAGHPSEGTERNSPVIFIEAELRREDPVSNILKVWRRALHGKQASRTILIQGFSRVYRSRKYHNRCIKGQCARDFGKMMQESTHGKVSYIPVRMNYYPRAGSNEGNGARHDAAVRFGDTIATHLRKLHIPLN